MTVDLFNTLDKLSDRTKEKFVKKPDVVVKDDDFDVEKLPIGRTWHRLTDVVAVVFDMLHSTNLEKGRRPASTASIYDAGVGGVVSVLDKFDADFVDIQGDGGFGLFWGGRRYERAMCAAITIRDFSNDFARQLKAKWPDAPTTGFKVGVASGSVLAKRVGLERHLDMQEPVWAGHPVNFAAKAAQHQTDADHIIITDSIWDQIRENDYLTFSCGCGGLVESTPTELWTNVEIDKIPGDDRFGQVLGSTWCRTHGERFCNAILDGETRRIGISEALLARRTKLGSSSLDRIRATKDRDALRQLIKQDTSLVKQLANSVRSDVMR